MAGKIRKIFKKKGFVIDKISEDSFYENLLLKLSTFLKTSLFVSHVKLERLKAATLEEVVQWEACNIFRLPEDLRNFYLSSNGFSFTYQFQYDKSESEELNFVSAGIEVNPLSKLEKVAQTDKMFFEHGLKVFIPFSNVYVLAKVDDNNTVVMSQPQSSKPPYIWLHYNKKNFYFLCEDFTTYFRMAIAHLGVPSWQLCVLQAPIPEWSSEMFTLLAPGIFDRPPEPKPEKTPLNSLDSDLFELAEINYECPFEEKSKKKTKKEKVIKIKNDLFNKK